MDRPMIPCLFVGQARAALLLNFYPGLLNDREDS